MKDDNARPLEVEVSFDEDGRPYFSWGVYLDTSEVVSKATLEYLESVYPEELEEADYARYLAQEDAR